MSSFATCCISLSARVIFSNGMRSENLEKIERYCFITTKRVISMTCEQNHVNKEKGIILNGGTSVKQLSLA